MIKILSIGNSFSQDATRYLYEIARTQKIDMKVINLFIGGCPLSYHYKNTLSNDNTYSIEVNGMCSGFFTSIEKALLSESFRGWDFVTMQQVSSKSINYDTYQPYLNKLSQFVMKYSPEVKQLIHQTWAYADGSDTIKNLGYDSHGKMFDDIKDSYDKAYSDINASGLIPSGQAMKNLLKNGIEKIHRDPIHASLGLGRFTLGLTWYEYITGNCAEDVIFNDFDEPVNESEIKIAKLSAHEAVDKYKNTKRF